MNKAQQLRDDGYCVIKGVLKGEALAHTRSLAANCVAEISAEHRAKWRSEGSLIHLGDHPDFADLIAYPPALEAMQALQLGDIRFSSGYVISKPPNGPALFWHQDWWGWDHPVSVTDQICQIFLFYYLTDTTPENGCLRVIPGSHRRRHPLHDLLDAHSEDLASVDNANTVAFADSPDAVAVPVSAGDLVIGDARLLHGTYPNASGDERTLITLWYHPGFSSLSGPLLARIAELYHRTGTDTDPGGQTPDDWPEPARTTIRKLVPRLGTSDGHVSPQPWNRTPKGLR